jgi:hypothetical protein
MLKQKKFPKVLYEATDISLKALSYGRDSASIPMLNTEYLYFGLYKPFNHVYVEMGTANTNATTMSIKYYNGSSYVTVARSLDDTQGLTRSGYISFDRPTDWAESTEGGEAKYFVKISFSASLSAGTTLQGMNLVFSDDQDLKGIYPYVSNYLNSTETTFILRHENSRDLIIQELRNRGHQKKGESATFYENVDAWDLLELNEVRLWSTYLTMANIFSSLQSNEGDMFKQKADEYMQKAEFYKAGAYLTLDKDDDGLIDDEESAKDVSVRRLVRR